MEAVNGVSDGGGPPPPSPLTGCYLLIVIGEPHSQEHKNIILQRIAKGLLSWDVNNCLIDLEKELAIITEQAPEGEEARYGERLIQYASENLVTEVLIHPAVSTLAQCVRNLLSSFTRHRHIIHAGYTFAANGSWILQDGTFSYTDFAEAFHEIEVQRVIRAYENSISVDLHCSPEGDWTRLPKESFAKSCKVRVNPVDVLTSGSPSITNFLNYVSPFLVPVDVETLLECSDVVGNIRFSHATLYIFPGGQGDAALFGINGFNMLLDGGFSRKACFWDFVRHLDRLDAVLLTRLNNGNVCGISAVLRRKMQNALYPQIGHFFCNIQERKSILSPDGDKDKDPLLINLLDEGQEIITNLRKLNLAPQTCYRDSEPINLYHKVGHGTLDMYVLSPTRDSKEVKDFLHRWNTNDQKLFANHKNIKDFQFPLQNMVSICTLLIWQPANPNDNITRILYPGSTPQHKIFEGLDRLKNLEYIKYPVCSESKLITSSSIMALKSKQLKDASLEKLLQPETRKIEKVREKPPKSGEIKSKLENKLADNLEKLEMTNGISSENEIDKTVKKSDSTDSDKSMKSTKPRKTDDKSEEKRTKPETKPKESKAKPKVDSKVEKKRVFSEKKASPTTPKKTLDAKVNGDMKEKEKPISKPIKYSPSSTPAKSAKEATNRKVIESKNKMTTKKEPKLSTEKKDTKPERKPISRRSKGSSPTTKTVSSPVKKVNGVQKPDIIKKSKLDKEGTTDSSTVSTPSADQKDLTKLTAEEIEQLKAQELADLKEEQEVVKEIEAVFRKGEIEKDSDVALRKVKDISIEDKSEPEEYLIIEKEEVEHDSLDDKDTKEDETKKHARDSEESEKVRKLSDDIKILLQEKEQLQKQESEEAVTDLKIKDDKEKPVETSKDMSVTSPEDKIDTSLDKKIVEIDSQEPNVALESQPDERYSATVESGATTAPTLPEDERITLDEIKEDNGDQAIEEKHVKEDTKEKDVPVIQLPTKTIDTMSKLPPVVGIRLDKQSHIRDIVKTPDEVADLPVHEEADIGDYHIDVIKSGMKGDDMKMEMKPQEKVEADVKEEKDKDTTIKDGEEEASADNGDDIEEEALDAKKMICSVQKIKTAEDMKQVTEDRKPPSVKDIEITLEAKELEKTRIEDEKLQKLKDEEVKDIETEVAEKPDETKYVKEKVIRKTVDVQSENAKDSDLAVAAKVEQLNVCTMEKDTVDIKPEAEEVKHEKPVQDGKITREEIVENTEPEREAVENKEIKIIDTKDNQKETVKDIKIDSQKEVETVEVTEITKTMEEDEVPDSIKPIPKEKVESMEEHDTMKIQSEKVSCQEPVEAEKMKEFEITEPTKAKKENDLEPTKPTVEEKTEGMDDTEKEHDATKVESEIIEQEKVEPQEKFETLQAEKAEVKVTGTVKANEEKDQKSTKSVPGEKVEAMGDIDKKEDTLKLEKQLEKEKVTSQEKPETIQPKKIEEIEVCETTKAKEEKDLEPMKPVLAGKEEGAESIEKVQDTIKVEPKIIEEEKVTSQEKLETIQPKKIKDIQLSEATKITERKDSESTKPVLEKEVESIKDDKKEVEVGLTKTIDDTKDIDQEKMAMDTKITKDKIEESELISASKVDDPQIAEIEKIKEAAEEEKDVADALSREKLENVTVLQPDKIQEEKEKPVPITEEQKIDEVKLITEEKLDKIENEAVKKGEIVMPEGDTIDKTKINDTDEENAALKKQTEEAQIDQIKKVESVVQEKEKSSEVSPLEVEEPKSIQIEKAQETKSLSIQKDVDKKKEEVIDEAGLESSTVIPGDTTQIENKSEHVGREKMTEKDTTEETVIDKINETMEKTHVPVKEELTQVQNATASRTDTRQEFSKSDKADVKELENELETDQKDITGISEQKIEEKIEAQEKEIMSMEQSKITSEMSTNDVKETEGIIETSEGVSKVLIQAQLEQSKQTTKTDLEKTSQGDKCIKVDATEDKKHEKLTPEVKEILAAKEKEEPAELKILSEISAQKELPISETVKESNDLANVSQDKQLGLEEEQVSEQVPTGKDLKQELEECILDNEAKLSQIEQIKQIDFDDTSEERDVTFYIGDQKLEKTKADQKDEKPESKEQEKSRLDEKDTDDKQKQTDEFETDMPRKGEDIPGEKKADELHESAEVHSEPKLISSISEKKSETKEVEEVIEVKKDANADQVDKSHVVLHKDTEVEKAEIMIPGTSVEAMYDSNKYANGVQDRIETIQKPIVTEKNVVEDEKGTKEIAEQKVNKEEVNDQTLKEDTEMTNGESTKDIENDKIDDKIISVAKEAKESRQSDSKDIRIDQEQQILESKPSIPAIDATATVSDIDRNKELSTGKVVDKDGAFLRETQIDETKSGSQTESPETSSEQALQTFKENEILDKVELGRKSPKEREQDVAKIVASVAEVLKSDAPLEEFEGKIPLSITPPFVPFTATYTTELRETHITTVDSPVSEIPKTLTESKSESRSVLKESNETEESEAETSGSKISSLMRDSKELMEATSKIISGIKSKTDETKSDTDPGTVHRMLVTASSEDGGEETEICPKGTITFSKSSESSGRSSPDLSTQKLKEEDDNKMSSGKSTPDIKITAEHEKADLESTEKVFLDEAKDSGKSTPKSGKMSPEIREQSPTSDSGIIEVTKQDFQKSGKSTPDRSGKSTPDIKEKGASVETDKKSSDSGRSTPDTAPTKIDTLTKPVVKTAFDSGRSSPDSKSIEEIKQLEKPEHEKTTADEADQVFDEHKSLTTSDKLSEKSSSVEHKHDVVTEDSRASITEVSEPLSSTSESKEISSDTSGIEKQEEQQVVGDIQQKQEVDLEKRIQSSLTDASGKSTPDITQSVISGKSSPDLKQDSESITSRTSTPGLKEIAEDKREESKDKGLTSDTSDPLGKDLPAKDINLEAADGRGPKNIHIESKLDELKTDEIPPAYEDLEQMKVKVLDDTQFQTSTVSAPLKTEVETKDIDKAVDIKMSEKKIYTIKDEEDNIVKKEVEVKSIVVQEKVEDPTLDKKTSVKHEDIKIEQDAETKENVHKDKDNSLNIQTAAPSECESIKATQEVIPSDKKDGLTEKPDIATEEHTKNGIIADQTMNEKERELKDNDTKITEVGDVITKDIKQEISKPADKTEEELRKETELLDKGDSNETDKPLRYEIEVVNKMQSALDAIGQEMQAECLKRSKSAEHDEHIEKDETSDIDAKHDKDISKSVLTQHEIDAKEIPQAKETTEHQKHSEESKVKDKDESSKVAIKDAAQQGEKFSKKEEKSIISYEIETADSKLLASDSKADVKVTVMSQETEDKDKRQTIEDTKIPEKNDDQELSKTVTEDKESLVKPADEQTIQERSTNIPTDFTAAEIAQELAEDSKDVKETTHDSTSASDDIAAVDETKQLIQKQNITVVKEAPVFSQHVANISQTDASEKRAKQDDLKSLTAKELPTDSQHHTILTKEDSKPNDREIIIKKDVLDTSTEIPDIQQYVEKDIAKESVDHFMDVAGGVKDDESKEKTLTASEKKILEEAVLKDAKHGEKKPAEDPTDTKTILEEKVLPSTEDKVQDSSGKKEFSEDVAIKKSDMQEQLSVDHSDGQLKNCKIKEETKTESDEISTKVIVEATVVKPESQDVVKVKEESPKETDISTLTKHLIDKTHIDNQETKDDTSETIGTTKTIEREELSSIEKIVSGAKEDISNVVETGTKIVETYVTTSDAAKDIQQVESKILPADKEHENEISHAKHSDITTTIELSRHIDKDVKGKVDEPSTEKESAKLEESKSVDQKVVDSTAKIVEDNSDSSKSSVIVDDIKTGDDKHDIHSAVEESDAVTSIKTETSVVEKTVKDTITSKDLDIGKDILGKGIKDEVRVCIKSEKEVSTKDDATKESISSIACSSKELAKPEESSLSGKSTPDIADVERDKQIQETLTYEKHIPGSSTPPTVPVSPIVKDIHTDIKSDISPEKKMETTVSTIKEQDIRSYTPGSDEYEHGISSTHSDISLSQMSRAPHLLEGDEARESDEDDILGSPTSVTSQIGHSPSSQYDFDDDKRLSKTDQMSVSFYGTLPGDADDSGFKSGRFLDDSDLDFEKAMQEHRQVRGEDLTGESSSYLYEITAAKQSGIMKEESGKKTDIMTSSFIGTELPDRSTTVDTSKEKDPIGSWGKPLSLPSPAPPDNKGTPKKEKKLPPNVTAKNKLNDDKKRSESPSKKQRKSGGPIYVDLTYVPHHGNSNYSYVDFFKRIRARYYVFSGIEPSKEVYNALLEAKQTWEDKELEVTIIPTYDTDVLGYWVAENEELLTKYKIDLSPSASRCTINLQDHETSCSAYRLEF